MRSLLLVICSFYAYMSNAQVSWEPMTAHVKQSVEILYVDEERILGLLDDPRVLVTSEDRGNSWQEVASDIPDEADLSLNSR